MLRRLKAGWRELKHGRPGRRFEERYLRARQGPACGRIRKCLLIAGGFLIVLVGIVFLPMPGPGMLIIAIGALMMAEESRAAARTLDWLEAKARRLVKR